MQNLTGKVEADYGPKFLIERFNGASRRCVLALLALLQVFAFGRTAAARDSDLFVPLGVTRSFDSQGFEFSILSLETGGGVAAGGGLVFGRERTPRGDFTYVEGEGVLASVFPFLGGALGVGAVFGGEDDKGDGVGLHVTLSSGFPLPLFPYLRWNGLRGSGEVGVMLKIEPLSIVRLARKEFKNAADIRKRKSEKPRNRTWIPLASKERIAKIVMNDEAFAALTETGKLLWWSSRMPNAAIHPRANPELVMLAIRPDLRFVEVGLGVSNGCAVTHDGAAVCWRSDGQHGLIGGVSDAKEIAVGAGHACVTTKAGKVLCWGSNNNGALGDGTDAGGMDLDEVAKGTLVATEALTPAGMRGLVIDERKAATCGVAAEQLVCWGYPNPFPPMRVPSGDGGVEVYFRNQRDLCARTRSGEFRCGEIYGVLDSLTSKHYREEQRLKAIHEPSIRFLPGDKCLCVAKDDSSQMDRLECYGKSPCVLADEARFAFAPFPVKKVIHDDDSYERAYCLSDQRSDFVFCQGPALYRSDLYDLESNPNSTTTRISLAPGADLYGFRDLQCRSVAGAVSCRGSRLWGE